MRKPFDGNFPITLGFEQTYAGLYTDKSPHKGIDYALPPKTPVKAIGDGVVSKTGFEKNGYGNFLIVNHSEGLKSIYAHLNSISVAVGQKVVEGKTIGLSGSTGNSTGPHLHLELKNAAGESINPEYYLSNIEYNSIQCTEISRGQCSIVCNLANVRDMDMNIIGQLRKGDTVVATKKTVNHNGLTYRVCTAEFLIAEVDSYGTQILRNVT